MKYRKLIMFSAIGGAILGGISSAWGQSQANSANQGMASDQMSFQERMSGSAYQRAMRDMKLAGLNPMLAYQQGGASTPGGSSAVMHNVGAAATAGATNAANSASTVNTNSEQQKQLQEQQAKTREEVKNLASQRGLTQAQTNLAINQIEMLEEQIRTQTEQTRLTANNATGSEYQNIKNEVVANFIKSSGAGDLASQAGNVSNQGLSKVKQFIQEWYNSDSSKSTPSKTEYTPAPRIQNPGINKGPFRIQ